MNRKPPRILGLAMVIALAATSLIASAASPPGTDTGPKFGDFKELVKDGDLYTSPDMQFKADFVPPQTFSIRIVLNQPRAIIALFRLDAIDRSRSNLSDYVNIRQTHEAIQRRHGLYLKDYLRCFGDTHDPGRSRWSLDNC